MSSDEEVFAHRVPQRGDRHPHLRLLGLDRRRRPLATYAEPHTYDLCTGHAERLTVPRGWEVVRLSGEYVEPEPSHDDLLALANAVREAGKPKLTEHPTPQVVSGQVGRADESASGAVETAVAVTCASCAISDWHLVSG